VLNVSASSLPLPTGAATAANQVTEISHLADIDTQTASIDGKIPANLTVTATRLLVDGSGVVQPISASSLPLPTGAATETTLSLLEGKVPANLTVTATRLLVDGSGVTQPISAASLPLPTGAASETTLSSIDGKVPANLTVTATRLLVDGSGVTQPISGTVTVNALTNSSVVKAQLQDNAGNALNSTSNALNVSIQNTSIATTPATPAAGTVTQAAVSVGTSAVRATVSGSAPSAGRKVLIVVPDPDSIAKFFIGSSSVASSGASRGIPVQPGQSFEASNDAGDYYIISDTAAQTVFIMEQS
jgi:hypothetical protein